MNNKGKNFKPNTELASCFKMYVKRFPDFFSEVAKEGWILLIGVKLTGHNLVSPDLRSSFAPHHPPIQHGDLSSVVRFDTLT